MAAAARLDAAESQREAARLEVSKLSERNAVLQTESRMHQEATKRTAEQAEGEE